jgi:hypothetical protein
MSFTAVVLVFLPLTEAESPLAVLPFAQTKPCLCRELIKLDEPWEFVAS